ncbi:recombinase family protein [Deinococcus maricopensis]|uniref:Resolvase domain protein n=1 Tax=Deinococcus maricopensis (strain DSM 21211 / LMG 22137 / NRRL B-23946 / LB-34) TaxID=709986 RepID=E8UAI2_DEIML|nr:recombinase family protein [Deinococcus maricopensis]ADV68071.1 Resolvase domain protein [Deinococcus maricopensis DSM 21211]
MTDSPTPLAYIRSNSFTTSATVDLNAQRQLLTSHAQAVGLPTPQFFDDHTRPGTPDVRPGLEALLSSLQPKQLVITPSLATIGQRDAAHTLALLDRITAILAHLLTLQEHIDTRDPSTMDLRAILQALDHIQREYSSTRNLAERVQAIKQGAFPLGEQNLPYVYTKDAEGQIILDAKARDAARQIFLLKPGRGVKQLSEELARQGISTPTGGTSWAPNVLRNILINTAYKSKLVYGQKTYPDEPDRPSAGQRGRMGGSATRRLAEDFRQLTRQIPPHGAPQVRVRCVADWRNRPHATRRGTVSVLRVPA